MTVRTIKMSDFAQANLNNSTNELVGISSPSGGINIREPVTVNWTTATRPSSPYDGLMGYNTSLEVWEYWQASTSSWVQFTIDTNTRDWVIVTAASTNAVINMGYITNRSATPAQIVLPLTFSIGNEVEIMGLGSSGWSLVANTGQKIQFGSLSTSTDGSINSDIQYSNILVRGLVANTTWSVITINSNPTIL